MPAIRAKRRDQGGKGLEVRRVPGEEMSQKAAILDWLKREPITAIQALAHIRCMRLAARIDELRHEGYAIHTEMITVGSGKQVARYVLVS